MGIFIGGNFLGANCPVGIIRVAIFLLRVFLVPLRIDLMDGLFLNQKTNKNIRI